MRTNIIAFDYICYGGDSDRTLYLQQALNPNGMNLCLEGDDYSVCHHLTSTEPEYQEWLIKHHASLLLINKEQWYVSKLGRPEYDLYNTFHQVLDKLHKLIKAY